MSEKKRSTEPLKIRHKLIHVPNIKKYVIIILKPDCSTTTLKYWEQKKATSEECSGEKY